LTEKKARSDNGSEITKRLDAIIRLQMSNLSANQKISMANLYTILQDSGLSTVDIGKIVKKAPNKISSEIIHYKNDLKKKAGKKRVKKNE